MISGRICCQCDLPIAGDARRIPRDSMSGARPDDWAHPSDAECRAALEAARIAAR